jgi:cell division protein FtsW (lipid II flippase)
MKDQSIFRDERTTSVENASYRWGYMIVTYGLLLLVAIRGFLFQQSNWDLMALVIVSSLVTTAYQGAHHLFTRRWIYLFGATILISGVVAVLVVLVLK